MSCFSCVLSGFDAQKRDLRAFPSVSERFWRSKPSKIVFEILEKTIFETSDWKVGTKVDLFSTSVGIWVPATIVNIKTFSIDRIRFHEHKNASTLIRVAKRFGDSSSQNHVLISFGPCFVAFLLIGRKPL